MYLTIFRTIQRRYTDVFKLLESCVSDTELSPQEQQYFNFIGKIQDAFYPDTHACRLKLYLVTSACQATMPFPFDLKNELTQFVRKYDHVSAACRLTPDQELFLLSRVMNDNPQHELINRERFLRALFHEDGQKSLFQRSEE